MARGLQSAGRAWFSSAGRGAVLVLRRSESRVYKCRDKRRVTGGGAASTQRFHEPRLCPAAAASTLPGGYPAVTRRSRSLPLPGGYPGGYAAVQLARTQWLALFVLYARRYRASVMAGGRSHGRASGRASGRRACVRPSLRSSTSRRSKNVIAHWQSSWTSRGRRSPRDDAANSYRTDAPCH